VVNSVKRLSKRFSGMDPEVITRPGNSPAAVTCPADLFILVRPFTFAAPEKLENRRGLALETRGNNVAGVALDDVNRNTTLVFDANTQ
jgi:hypothetical protein